MKLPHGKKTKTGYSTAADVLEKLAEWKGVSKEEMEKITWENGLRLFSKVRV